MTYSTKHFGWLRDLPDQRDHLYTAPVADLAALPTSVDLRSHCPPVYDQGQLGSCTGNGIAAALQSERMKQKLTRNMAIKNNAKRLFRIGIGILLANFISVASATPVVSVVPETLTVFAGGGARLFQWAYRFPMCQTFSRSNSIFPMPILMPLTLLTHWKGIFAPRRSDFFY